MPRHDELQNPLMPVTLLPDPKAAGPAVRRVVEASNNSELWVARLAETLNVAAPAPVTKHLKYVWVGPFVLPCGTDHIPCYDRETEGTSCNVCGTPLTQRIID